MSEHSVLYDVLETRVSSVADSFDNNVPIHKFSRRYIRKEKEIIKAYIKSKEKHESVERMYHRISLGKRIRFVFVVIIAAFILGGFTIYITHYIGNMRIDEYDTHSFAFELDGDNAPEMLESKYEITYDLSDWDKETLEDDQYGYFVTYRKKDVGINFSYRVKTSYKGVRYNTEGSQIETKTIGGKTVIYYITSKGVNCLIWESEKLVFEFSYRGLNYEKAVEIISSITKQ